MSSQITASGASPASRRATASCMARDRRRQAPYGIGEARALRRAQAWREWPFEASGTTSTSAQIARSAATRSVAGGASAKETRTTACPSLARALRRDQFRSWWPFVGGKGTLRPRKRIRSALGTFDDPHPAEELDGGADWVEDRVALQQVLHEPPVAAHVVHGRDGGVEDSRLEARGVTLPVAVHRDPGGGHPPEPLLGGQSHMARPPWVEAHQAHGRRVQRDGVPAGQQDIQ